MLTRAFPQRIEVQYRKNLNRVLDGITKATLDAISNPLKNDYVADAFGDYLGRIISELLERFTGIRFQRIAETIARAFVDDSLKFSDGVFSNGDAKSLGVNAYNTPKIREVISLATEQNAQLIRSIASQHINAIAGIVYENVMAGNRPREIEAAIRSYGVTKSRAKLIARDQTAKVLSSISRARQQDAGFEFFKWDTSHDERVRASHKEAQNRVTKYGVGVYRWDDPPVIHGEKLTPGMDYQCRCVALPVLESEVEEFQRNQRK